MADHGLDGSSASHLAANDFCDAADLAANPDPEPVGIVMAAIALVAVDAADSNTCELFEISDDGTERVAVVRIAMRRLGMQHELSAIAVAGVAIDTLQPNSYGARALPRPMHSTSGACHE